MIRKSAILIIVAAIAILAAQGQQPARARTAAEIEPMLAKIATYEYGQSRVAVAEFSDFVRDSMSNPELLKQIEASLLKYVQSNVTAAAKTVGFRELSGIAADASIPVLAALVLKPDTAEMATYALARIPGAKADDALRTALGQTSGKVKIAIVNNLGRRRDAKAVPALKPLVSAADAGMAEAAAQALATIGDAASLDAIGAAREKASGALRQRLSEAYLRCAEQLAASGGKPAALKAYKQLIALAEADMVRVGALADLTAADSKAAAPELTAALSGNNARVQGAAIRLLAGVPGGSVTTTLVGQFPKLPPAAQVQLLGALAIRNDPAARPLLVKAAGESTGEVRTAALAGLGVLGDESCVPLLAKTAAASQGAEQATARASLYRLRGAGVDAAIVAAIGTATGKEKIELITAASERANMAAADTLVKAVNDGDADVRRAAMKSMRNVAGPAQVPALLDLLSKAPATPDRREASLTLAAALRRSGPQQVTAVVKAYDAAPPVETRVALLEVMGQISAGEALPVLRKGLKDPAPEIVRASILALSEWSDPAPIPDLVAVATSGTEAQQILALRGYLKLMALPSQRPIAESVKILTEAMRLAKQPTEKKAVLSLLPMYPTKESLQLAEAAVNDQAVAQEAKAAVKSLRAAMNPR